MRIVCEKENDAKKMLELVKNLLETECMEYPILKEDLVLEISLKDKNGKSCPQNEEIICFEEKDLHDAEVSVSILEYYYNNDALTKLYNRAKYEQDIANLQENDIDGFACIYIDAVGLHEVNNHLGHAAGDHMLCSIADGIRQNFTYSSAYRIGGDEFVIFCFHQKEAEIKQAISNLRNLLKQEKYEISVGMETDGNGATLIEIINRAEHAMRYDKAEFYRKNGAERQMRVLNYKLEKILLEKQDASQFLSVIASEYKGVYMVNPDKDTCRYIYIPEYFKNILNDNDGVFSKSIAQYSNRFVSERDQERFQIVFNYNYVLKQIKQGNQVEFTYEKKDGDKVHLQITIYDPNSLDSNEMLWIFMDGNRI